MDKRDYSILCILSITFFLSFLILFPGIAQEKAIPKVRKAAYQGSWYPDSSEELGKMIQGYYESAKLPELEGQVLSLISPHAGYRYSGKCAAHAYKAIAGKDYDRVFLLGFSHHYPIQSAAVSAFDSYETPLGRVNVDRRVCDKLLEKKIFSMNMIAEEQEHSIEIQLPFLQTSLKDFSIIPILVGDLESEEDYRLVAAALKEFIDKRTLVVASSDLTHYGKNYGYLPFRENVKENLKTLDSGAILRMTNLDFKGFQEYLRRTGDTICGKKPISLLLTLLDKNAKGILLKYYTSGDILGDHNNSVSYAAIAFIAPNSPAKGISSENRSSVSAGSRISKKVEAEFNPDERSLLLKLARETITSHLKGWEMPDGLIERIKSSEKMMQKRGVFVTIKKHGDLRGCIGYIQGIKPLYQAVIDNALSASTKDHRFPPMSASEINEVKIEISIMSPLRKIDSLEEIVVGQHGLYLEFGNRHGVLLPQVATEEGWNREEFLNGICRKSGLPENTWRTARPTLWVFSAEVFGEE
ncbi:MAG: AmmeMemoRadiSam system protein B [Acidobacteriota bacterium]